MERGELQSKLQELKTLHELDLLSLEQVQRTTDELLKAFATPTFKLLQTAASVNDSGRTVHHEPTPMGDGPVAPGLSGTAAHDTPESGTLEALAEAMSLQQSDICHDEGTSRPTALLVPAHPLAPTIANQASFCAGEPEPSVNDGTSPPLPVSVLPHHLRSCHVNQASFHSPGMDHSINEAPPLLRESEGASEARHQMKDDDDYDDLEEEGDDTESKEIAEMGEVQGRNSEGTTPSAAKRAKWRFLACKESRDEVEKYLSEMGLLFSWHRGGGKKGGYTKLCKSHKDCEFIVRVSLVRAGWMVCCRGEHSEAMTERYRGILPKYVEEIDAGCLEKRMPKEILKQLRLK